MGTITKYILLSTLFTTILVSQHGYAQSWNKIGITSPTTGWATTPAISVDKNGIVYVAFLNNNDQASVMKYDGSSWTAVGRSNISSGSISNCGEPTPIAVDTSGDLYIAYPDTNGKATVMKFNGSSWAPLGSPCFSGGAVTGIALAVDANSSTPYVVYPDTGGSKATVMKYNGIGWVAVGTPRFSAGYAFLPSIAIAPDGTPYIAYCDNSDLNMITVMKYNGTDWVTVGGSHLSAGSALYPSLAIDKTGTPYVAYMDEAVISGGATVMKYNGVSWVSVGLAGAAGPGAQFPTLAIDAGGTPYVSYSDHTTANQQATVTKYNGSAWVIVGTAGFSAGAVSYAPIAIDPSGALYVTYTDTITTVSHVAVMKFDAPAPSGVNSISKHVAASISVFPDPTHGAFTINISSAVNEDAIVIITNILGEQVNELTLPTNKETTMHLYVPPGTYYLSATMGNEKATSKIAVE